MNTDIKRIVWEIRYTIKRADSEPLARRSIDKEYGDELVRIVESQGFLIGGSGLEPFHTEVMPQWHSSVCLQREDPMPFGIDSCKNIMEQLGDWGKQRGLIFEFQYIPLDDE